MRENGDEGDAPRSRLASPFRQKRNLDRRASTRERRSGTRARPTSRCMFQSEERMISDNSLHDCAALLTSVFHILIIISAAVRRTVSSGDHARQETGSVCSRKILSSVNPVCMEQTETSVRHPCFPLLTRETTH